MSESILSSVGHLLVHSGKSALSRFALSKLQVHVPTLKYAEYVHILKVAAPLTPDESKKVDLLLDYGPNQGRPERQGRRVLTVLPRTGTISPWSSKATDIFQTSGLKQVERVERGIRWYASGELNEQARLFLYDRMTQSCQIEEDFASIFTHRPPVPLGILICLNRVEARWRGLIQSSG